MERTGKAGTGRARTVRGGVAWALALLLLAACAPGGGGTTAADLPEFPEYEPAHDFLERQRRIQAAVPPPSPEGYPYTERNRVIYRDLERQLRLSRGTLEARAQAREQRLLRSRTANLDEWQAMRRRLARDEAVQALREQERARTARRNDRRFRQRFENYQARLERLAQRQEALAEERERNAFRHQQRVEAQLEALQQRQVDFLRERVEAGEAAQAPPAEQ